MENNCDYYFLKENYGHQLLFVNEGIYCCWRSTDVFLLSVSFNSLLAVRFFVVTNCSILGFSFVLYNMAFNVVRRSLLYKMNKSSRASQLETYNRTTQLFAQQQSTVTIPRKFNLSFEEYQKIKRKLKTNQRIAGVPFAFLGTIGSSMLSAYMFPDMFDATPENVQLILGLDPLMFCGISGVVAGGISYFVGTNTYKFFWKTSNKEESQHLNERDADFLQRLEKYRFQGDSKFEDDYYGESIKTLSDYRQWVRTHQKKRETSEKFKLQTKDKNEN